MALVLRDLRKQFSAGGDTFIALDGVTLTIPDGQFVAIMGSNGAGKSTLLNSVAGSVFVDSGSVELDGRELSNTSEHRRARYIGRVFQDPRVGTAPDLTVAENFALAALRGKRLTLRRGVTTELRERIVERLNHTGIHDMDDRLDQLVGTLSGGQRQAVALLMATWTQPNLLLLDEHTAALDPNRAAIIMDMTDRIQEEMDLTVLMVTHNPQQAIDHGQRLLMMHAGRVVADVADADKKELTRDRLLGLFERHGVEVADRTLLSADEEVEGTEPPELRKPEDAERLRREGADVEQPSG